MLLLNPAHKLKNIPITQSVPSIKLQGWLFQQLKFMLESTFYDKGREDGIPD